MYNVLSICLKFLYFDVFQFGPEKLWKNSHLGPITNNLCNDDICSRIMSATPGYVLSSRSAALFQSPSCLHTLSLLLPLQLFWDCLRKHIWKRQNCLGSFPSRLTSSYSPHIIACMKEDYTPRAGWEAAVSDPWIIGTDIIVLTDVDIPNMFLSSLALHSKLMIAEALIWNFWADNDN